MHVCVRACVHAFVRVCVRACVRACMCARVLCIQARTATVWMTSSDVMRSANVSLTCCLALPCLSLVWLSKGREGERRGEERGGEGRVLQGNEIG